jgi:hypothetical protein
VISCSPKNDAKEYPPNDQPAVKLLDFFRGTVEMDAILRQQEKEDTETGGLAMFSTSKVQSISETMKTLPSLGPTDTQAWVKYWKSAGLF